MSNVVQTGFMKGVSLFFEYDTPKIVHIRSKKVGVINRIIQLVILAYIIGYAIVWEKGYQEFEDIVSVSRTKLKGTIYTNYSDLPPDSPLNNRLWDVADYVIPPQESDAFFVMTNVVVTENQQQGKCPEDPTINKAWCKRDSDCRAGKPVPNGNGVQTGNCVPSADKSRDVCQIYAWCPVENDTLPLMNQALLEDSKTFTVLIKNNIKFPKFNVTKRNILDSQDADYLKQCRYNASDVDDRLCPIFELDTIVAEANQDYSKLAIEGGVIEVGINWDCNLDLSLTECRPKYDFVRLDPETAKISPGWNFRYANYYWVNNTKTRDFYKAVGIRFVIKVTGRAGKFSTVPLLLSLGSGLGLLAVATVLCDLVVLYCLKKGNFYREKKYLYVTGDDAFKVLDSDDDDDRLLGESDDEQPTILQEDQERSYHSMDDSNDDGLRPRTSQN